VLVARPVNVEVDTDPVLTPDGPTTIGTTICRVWPLLSVDVLVRVERIVLVSSGLFSVVFDVLCSCLLLLDVAEVARVDCGCSSSESAAAAYACSMTSSGIGQRMPEHSMSRGPRNMSSANSSASHLATVHEMALGKYDALSADVLQMPRWC
jgi:hypothetical protein